MAIGLIAFWSKGRGYKTLLIRRFFPDSNAALLHPSVRDVRPGQHSANVSPYAFIACDLNLPNSGKVVDGGSLASGVRLFRTHDQEIVPARVNTTGGGDAIVLRPIEPLRINTEYTFEVLPAAHDTAGASFDHFLTTFTTASGTHFSSFPAAAEKVELPETQLPVLPPPGSKLGSKYIPSYTCVTFGPDGRLYAATTDGRIYRYDIEPQGTIGGAKVIDTVPANNHADRLLIGLRFDPASTESNLVLWATHGQAMSTRQDDWTGKLSRLWGADLENYQDYVVGLPRAKADHATDQIDFGPDGYLYFNQASNTAMGAPDQEWGFRPERLLTAAVLRLDTRAISRLPLDVRTEEGGHYDPFAPGAPLTIYASGIRNGYDLLWHSNGHLYVPVNGSAAGGNAPGTPTDGSFPRRTDQDISGPYSGPAVPPLANLPTQGDFLFRIEKSGYYGHPNPTRAEYVINGGNPGTGHDLCQVPQYPPGMQPDRNWRHPAYDFGKNLAPCGLIEYKGDAFPALKGRVLVARYSGGKDVFVLSVGKSGEITETYAGIEGFTSFYDPLDLCESPRTGYLYVAEFGGKRITLLRPQVGVTSNKVIKEVISPNTARPVGTMVMDQ
jgi:glucose/arabinose dehydrogenase